MKAITVENLSKVYSVATAQSEGMSFREMLVQQVQSFFKKGQKQEPFYALKDVSFEVEQGEVLGIIGKNGSGKSTLLKILSKITAPTSGRAIVRGRVASLLEVGTGFHAELTGRENIFMSGIILGMKRWEINKHFDEIVSFAGVEKFLDVPVKKYSSGMRLRLAFSVAAHLQPEILLVDEVLAVGDYEFEKRCLKVMEGITNAGRTILFVSHNMDTIKRLCNRVLFLSQGSIVDIGDPKILINRYLGIKIAYQSSIQWSADNSKTSSLVELFSIKILQSNCEKDVYFNNQPLQIQTNYKIIHSGERIFLFLVFYDENNNLLFAAPEAFAQEVREEYRNSGEYASTCIIPPNIFKEGTISVSIQVVNTGSSKGFLEANSIIRLDKILSFFIKDANEKIQSFIWEDFGLIKPKIRWDVEKIR